MSLLAILGVVYGLCGLVALRLAVGHFAYRHPHSNGAPDWCEGAFCGIVPALIWPVAWLFAWGSWPWKVGAERDAETKAREQRIADLERELDIR